MQQRYIAKEETGDGRFPEHFGWGSIADEDADGGADDEQNEQGR